MSNGEHPTPTLDRGQVRPRPVSSSVSPRTILSALAESASRHIGRYAFALEEVLLEALDAHQGRGASPSAPAAAVQPKREPGVPGLSAQEILAEVEQMQERWTSSLELDHLSTDYVVALEELQCWIEERMSNSSGDGEGSAQGQEGAGHPPAKDQAAETPGNGRVVDPAAVIKLVRADTVACAAAWAADNNTSAAHVLQSFGNFLVQQLEQLFSDAPVHRS